jgi:hypothetical protein
MKRPEMAWLKAVSIKGVGLHACVYFTTLLDRVVEQ